MISFKAPISNTIQRHLGRASEDLSKSYERLASGMRINKASDDAASLSIAESLKTDTKLFSTAVRNVNDGMSALNIAASVLQSQNEIVTRLQELAEQNANGTYSNTQRETANMEYQALLREFGRIGDTAKFNGVNLLLGGRSGYTSNLNIQAGINGSVHSIISSSLPDSGSLSGTLLKSLFILSEPSADQSYTFAEIASLRGSALRLEVIDSLGNKRDVLISITGYQDSFDVLTYVRGDQSDGSASTSHDKWVPSSTQSVAIDPITGKVTGNPNQTFTFTGFQGGATASATINLGGLKAETTNGLGNYNTIELSGIETQDESLLALTVLRQRQSDISKIGAAQSRFSTAINVLVTQGDNSKAAESRIRDVDVSSEAALLISTQVRQQASAAVLLQANNTPQLILELLR